ncbi:acyl-CoA carboxylase subunit epsilon [Streptomyces sp. NPDC051041]|uniref:acyl-CoA carboxylase subunit epsilon n=1 Tax=Streptomyces sp. NPDC051041 TaxID=3365640 RepID=UPI00379B74CF
MSAAPIKVLRGAPTPEELAACVLVLQALATTRPQSAEPLPDTPPRAMWPRPTAPLAAPAAAWSSGRAGAWRAP